MIINFFKYLSVFLFYFYQVTPGLSAETTQANKLTNISISLGNLCQYIGKYQTNTKGDKNICDFRPHVGINYDHKLKHGLALYPQFHLNLPQNSRDKSTLKFNFVTLLNATFSPHEKFPLAYIAGGGLYFTNFIGKGGNVTLNNGQTQESFPRPKEYRVSYQTVINLGLNYSFHKKWSAETFVYTFNLFESTKRAFSAGLNINYHLGKI